MLERVIRWASEHPWQVLAALALVTALAAAQLPTLRFHISAEGMMVEHDPARALYRETQATFGEEEGLTVLFSDPDLFRTDRLEAVQAALEHIAALPSVARVESLFTTRNVTSRGGEIHTRPYLDPLPTGPEEAARVLADALGNPLVAGNLVGREGRTMAAIVYLREGEGEGDRERQAVQAIEAGLAPLSGTLERAFVIGSAYIRVSATEAMRHDQTRILPLVLAVPVLTLAIALRRPSGALVPLLTGGVSVVWTLGLMAATGTPVNVLTSIVPALVIIVGSSETTHMLAEFYEAGAAGKDTAQAIRSVAVRVGSAILLTFGTTYVGFLSIATSDIQILREFGLVASTALLFNFAVTVLLVPAYLALAYRRAGPAGRSRPPGHRLSGLAARTTQVILAHPGATLALLAGLAGACVWGAGLVRVNNDPLDYFAPDSTVMERLAGLRESLAGTESFSVVVNADIRGTFQQVHYLGELRRIQEYLASTARFDKTMSFADFVGFVHAVMEEDTSGRLPESDDVVREYLLFVDRSVVAPYVSEDYSRARILVRHAISSSGTLREALAGLEDFVRAEIDPSLHVQITGESVLTLHATDAIGFGQAKSLALMLVVIWLVVAMLYANSRAGLIAVAPVVLPVLAVFGTMGYLGIPLDTSTSMVAAISLGICVDDTMHFMARYHHHTRAHGDQDRALIDTVREEIVPILSTSVALALGFSTLALSSFPPVAHFGLLSALAMAVALLGTLTLLPLLLATTQLVTLWDLLTLELDPAVLERCPLFQGMRPWQVKKLVLLGGLRRYVDGETIVRQGESGDEMFVLLEGQASAWQGGADGTRTHLRDLGPGDGFGEIALVCGSPRTADVVAKGDTRVLRLDWSRIQRLGTLFPRITSRLFLNLAAVIGQRLADHTAQTPRGAA